MAGLVFGKYEKIRRLAEGGMGEVWLARQQANVKGFDRLVILKALKSDLSEEPGFVEQFLDEARVAATLNHPGIVALYEVGEWGGAYYIAMEYIAGDDLSRLWYAAAKRGVGLPFQVSVKIIHDAALALDHAHHASDVHSQPLNIVHRDVSPQNIMVRADGVTKLVDFGIAKAANRVSITKTGTVKGKLQYMSPEQVRGEPVDARSDQFSLGIVLWEMCTGKRLFKGDTELATLNKILQLPIPTPSSLVPGFPSELERVILRTLERDKQRRYARCSDVARELRAYLERAASQNGDLSVEDFVDDILGEELRARTKDLTPAPTQEGEAIVELGGRTEERPAHIEHQPAVLLKSALDAQVRRFAAVSELSQWILDGEAARDDLVSEDGVRWERIGDLERYARFFEVAVAVESVEEVADKTLSGGAPRALSLDELREPTTQSGEERSASEQDPLATQPVPALPYDDGDEAEQEAPARLTRDEQSHAQASAHAEGGASTVPVAALPPELDDLESELPMPARGGGIAWVFAGMAAVLLVAGAAVVWLDAELRTRALALLGTSSPAPTSALEETQVYEALAKDAPMLTASVLASLKEQYEARSGRARGRAAAFASLLASARARQAYGLALLYELAGEPDQAEATADEAQRLRIDAYKLAGEARTLAGELPEALLAMASYQAERGAVVETEADLASLERALERDTRDEQAKQRLREEAQLQRALADAASAVFGKDVLDKEVLALAQRGDARLGSSVTLFAAKSAPADDPEARAAVMERARFDANDPRRAALEAWATALSREPGGDAEPREKNDATSQARRATSASGAKTAPSERGGGSGGDLEARSAEQLISLAQRAHEAGESFQAAVLFRKALKADPRRVEAWMGSGWAYIDLGKGEAAVRSFRRAATLPNAPPEAHFGLAEAYRFAGQKAQAIKAYERYLKLAPSGADAHVAKNALATLRE